MQRGCRRAVYWPPSGVVGTLARVSVESCAGKLGFRRGRYSVKKSKWAVIGLKTGQRRDVPERIFANVATLKATSQCSREY